MRAPEPHPGSAWVVDALRAVFATDAGDGCRVAAPAGPEVDATWAQVVQAVVRHRVVGVVAPHAQALGCPSPVAARLHELHLHEVGRAMMSVHDTARASVALADAGIEHLVIKGVALAVVMGGRPVDRGGGDIDLWVRPADAARAVEALCAAGWERTSKNREPQALDGRQWAWMLRENQELPLLRAGGPPIDLHWRLYESEREFSFGFDAALAGSVPVPEVGPTVRTLGGAHALEYVAQHARRESWLALRQVADVLRLARVCGPAPVAALAAQLRNVRLGVAMAARLDDRLAGWVAPLSVVDARLVRESWGRCLAFDSFDVQQMRQRGWPLVVGRVRKTSWILRSAPGWGARSRHVTRMVARSRVLVDRRHQFWHGKSPG